VRVRPAALAVHTVLLTALVGGTFAYVSAQRTVTLDVDGSVRTVDTYARSVGDLLASAAVQVDARDAVSPALATTLVDGLRVAVVSARPVSLVVDGRSRQVWTTARSVDELTRQLGGRYRDAALSASRSTRIPLDGLALSVRMPKTVRVTADGRTVALVTTAATWRAALAEAGITVGASDSVSVDLAGAPVEGRSVTVTRRLTRSEVRIVAIPFTTQRRADATLYQGTTRVVQAGTPGRLRQTWVSTVVDGKVVARKQVGAKVLTAPVPRVVAVGTKARPAAASAPPRRTSVDSLNWAALARCESGGNPRAVGGGGQYFGLYQFSLGTWRSVGGPGHPLDASAAEQTYRAKRLYLRSGASPWPHCGRLLFT
jgi:uncharacterized protein YabE (DUF348 family)